jgi:hypothetical protein
MVYNWVYNGVIEVIIPFITVSWAINCRIFFGISPPDIGGFATRIYDSDL